MIKRILLCTVCLFASINPALASFWSDDFNSDTMDSTLWTRYDENSAVGSFTQSGGQLNGYFPSSGTAGVIVRKGYLSNVALIDWKQDFHAKIETEFGGGGGYGSSVLGVISGSSDGISGMVLAGFAKSYNTPPMYWTGIDSIRDGYSIVWDSYHDTPHPVELHLSYQANVDKLSVLIKTSYDLEMLSYEEANFVANYAPDNGRVFVGFVGDRDVGGYMDNFEATIGDPGIVVTPEPVSMILFSLGGLPIAVRMMRRKEA